MKLEQKKGFKTQKFELIGDKIKITHKSVSEFKEWFVNVEFIGEDIHIERKTRKGAIITATIILFIGTILLLGHKYTKDQLSLNIFIGLGIIYLVIGLVILISPTKSELKIIGGLNEISFFLDKPSSQEVENFANSLIKESRKIIKEKFAAIDPDLPEETIMHRLNWLQNRGLISKTEYEAKKKEYKSKKLMN